MKIYLVLSLLAVFLLQPACSHGFNIPPANDAAEGWRDSLEIRIWGWSRGGNVALSTERYTSESGGVGVKFYVINLITDEVLHTWSSFIEWEDFELYGIESVYESNKQGIITAMNNYGIIEHSSEFSRFPIVTENYTYTAFTREIEIEDYWLIHFNIIVARNGTEKIIRTAVNTDNADAVMGYFKSPFENRILVVSGTMLSSHGGISYNLSGCHLTAGY